MRKYKNSTAGVLDALADGGFPKLEVVGSGRGKLRMTVIRPAGDSDPAVFDYLDASEGIVEYLIEHGFPGTVERSDFRRISIYHHEDPFS